ncbi:MAG: TIGR03067 domain-containing protein [Gemmatimonadales bacterium]
MSTTKLLYLSVAVVTVTACAGAKSASVEGDWTIATATLGGAALPLTAFSGPLQMTRGTYVFQNDTGTYLIDRQAVPSTIDVHGLRGPNAGKTIPAIFRMDGDTLTICYDLSGKAHPRAFRSDSGTLLFLVRYTRAKPAV